MSDTPTGTSEKPPEKPSEQGGLLLRTLNRIADIGNKLPDPITLFVLLATSVIVLSVIFAGASEEVVQRDGTVATKTVMSLLSSEGVRWMFENAIDNFTGFAPLGSVLTVMLGIGVAERSGFITMGLRMLVQSVPKSAITATVVFAGVMSSMVADAGYVVLTPLGAVLFAGLKRHPLAGLAAAYAGVSGGFSANLFITGLDPLLAGLTQEAAVTVDPNYSVTVVCNWYFMVASTFLITIVGTLVTTRIVEPMLGEWDPSKADGEPPSHDEPTDRERKAFVHAAIAAVIMTVLLSLFAVIGDSPLREPMTEDMTVIDSLAPFFHAVELMIAALFFVPGVVYGVSLGMVKSDRDVAKMTSDTMATMGAYIVLAFAAAQFVAFFNWTNLGVITAVRGAGFLESMGLTGIPLIFGFLIVSSLMNLFVGSASAKWAFMAPIFVPMMMYLGYSPEAVQATYRVGDSITNIITPLMPYLPIIIVFAQKYDRDAGLGTLISAMLPYSIAFGIAWTIMLGIWFGLDIPLGPDVSTTYVIEAATNAAGGVLEGSGGP